MFCGCGGFRFTVRVNYGAAVFIKRPLYFANTFNDKHIPQCKFSLYLKKGGLASRNMEHFKN